MVTRYFNPKGGAGLTSLPMLSVPQSTIFAPVNPDIEIFLAYIRISEY